MQSVQRHLDIHAIGALHYEGQQQTGGHNALCLCSDVALTVRVHVFCTTLVYPLIRSFGAPACRNARSSARSCASASAAPDPDLKTRRRAQTRSGGRQRQEQRGRVGHVGVLRNKLHRYARARLLSQDLPSAWHTSLHVYRAGLRGCTHPTAAGKSNEF